MKKQYPIHILKPFIIQLRPIILKSTTNKIPIKLEYKMSDDKILKSTLEKVTVFIFVKSENFTMDGLKLKNNYNCYTNNSIMITYNKLFILQQKL